MSKSLRELVKEFEGCSLTAYQDGGGTWTIGYGHTEGVHPGMKITQKAAETFLRGDITRATLAVNGLVKVPLTKGQQDALIDFVFNLGSGNLRRSTLLQRLNAGHYEDVPAELKRWNKVNGEVSLGLTRRRAVECAMWNQKDPLNGV